MKQMSYIIHEEADYLAMQWEVRVALGEMEVSQVHISVCGTERDEESAEAVIGRLRRDFPKGEIIGCMAAEVVINGSVACDGILVSFSIFESARVEILGFSSEEMTPREMGQKLRARLEEIEYPRMVGILLSDVTMDITGFLESQRRTGKHGSIACMPATWRHIHGTGSVTRRSPVTWLTCQLLRYSLQTGRIHG